MEAERWRKKTESFLVGRLKTLPILRHVLVVFKFVKESVKRPGSLVHRPEIEFVGPARGRFDILEIIDFCWLNENTTPYYITRQRTLKHQARIQAKPLALQPLFSR